MNKSLRVFKKYAQEFENNINEANKAEARLAKDEYAYGSDGKPLRMKRI